MANIKTAEELRRIMRQVQERMAERAGEADGAVDAETNIKASVMDVMGLVYDTVDGNEANELAKLIKRELLQYGALQPYLDDDDITEIMVNGHDKVFVERAGRIEPVRERLFESERDVRRLVDKIASQLNKHCDAQTPYMDARLTDGSRVNAIIPPLSRFGTSVTIRKFPKKRLNANDLVSMGACSVDMMRVLACFVEAGCNILVSGGTGSGKTTLLNILCGFIPKDERVVSIEDTAELQLGVDDWVSLEARDANAEGTGEVSIHRLVVNSLRMRPDRIIVGECRSDETVEMLQAMNTGHDGCLTTIHANDPRAAFLRIETLVQATQNLSVLNIDMQIASAVQVVVQLNRYRDGTRKISEVTALTGGMEGAVITTMPLYKYVETGIGADGKVHGTFKSCGNRLPDTIASRIARTGARFERAWLERSESR